MIFTKHPDVSIVSCAVVLLGASLTTQARARTDFTYDSANRLVRSTTEDGAVTRYEYDALGNLVQRCSKAANGPEACSQYILDESQRHVKVLEEITSSGVTIAHAWGPNGLAAQKSGAASAQYPVVDHLRSVRELVDANANSLGAATAYDAYGNVRATKQPDFSQRSMFGFTGEQMDPDGTVYLRARHYMPSLGRFLQRDVRVGNLRKPQSFNRYAYVWGRPLVAVDPGGKDPLQDACDFAAGLGDQVTWNPFSNLDGQGHGLGDASGTEAVRKAFGIDDVVNKCSLPYRLGRVAGALGMLGLGRGQEAPTAPEGVEPPALPPAREPAGLLPPGEDPPIITPPAGTTAGRASEFDPVGRPHTEFAGPELDQAVGNGNLRPGDRNYVTPVPDTLKVKDFGNGTREITEGYSASEGQMIHPRGPYPSNPD